MRCKRSSTRSAEVAALKDEYRIQYPQCQYALACGEFVRFPIHFGSWLELDHIWGRDKCGEHWSNYAIGSCAAHLWKHRNLTVARIAIMAYKYRLAKLTGDGRHFDLDVLEQVSGYRLPGWIENQVADENLPSWCVDMGKGLLRIL